MASVNGRPSEISGALYLPYFHDHKAHINVLDFLQNVRRALSSSAPFLCADVFENHEAADVIENTGALKRYRYVWAWIVYKRTGMCFMQNIAVLTTLKIAKRHAYEAQFKLKAIGYAEEHGNRAAAREFKINESMDRKWRKLENELSFRGHKARWPELEERLEQWIVEQRAGGRSVSTVTIRLRAVKLAEQMKIQHFQGGPSWCFRFMKRCNVSIRSRTTATPTDGVSNADAFTIVTLSDDESVDEGDDEPNEESDGESDPLDEGGDCDDGGGESDEEWNPLEEILLEEALLQDSEEEEEDDDDDDSLGGLKINELCNECGCFFNPLKPHTCEHKAKPFPCNICGKRCVSEAALKIHCRVHGETYEIPCTYCHVTFKRKVDKLKHEKIHEEKKDPYKCPDCPKIFPTSKERRVHLSYHRATREFKCGVCGVEFRDIHHLQRHSVVHTGLKPFKCSVCERDFNQATNLKSHMRVHTGEKPYKCAHCDKSFNHNVSLKSHVQRFHSSVASDAEDGENKSNTGSKSDSADKQDTAETVQKESRRTLRFRGRAKSKPDGDSGLCVQNEDQCSNAKTSKPKAKRLKKSGVSDGELELERSDSDISFDSAEEEEQKLKARRSTRTSRRRSKRNSDGDFHWGEENEKCKSNGKTRGRRRKKVVV